MTTIDLNAHELLDKLRFNPISTCHKDMKELYDYCTTHLVELKKCDHYLLGSLFAFISYEKIGCRDAPRFAYICLTADTRNNKNETCSIIERLQLVMKGGIGLLEEKSYLFFIEIEKVIDFAIMADVLRLNKDGFNTTEDWWKNVLEDMEVARRKYPSYTDDLIISLGQKYHETVADGIYSYLLNIYS